MKLHRIPEEEIEELIYAIESGSMNDYAYVIGRMNEHQVVLGGLCAICPDSIMLVRNEVKEYLYENRPK